MRAIGFTLMRERPEPAALKMKMSKHVAQPSMIAWRQRSGSKNAFSDRDVRTLETGAWIVCISDYAGSASTAVPYGIWLLLEKLLAFLTLIGNSETLIAAQSSSKRGI